MTKSIHLQDFSNVPCSDVGPKCQRKHLFQPNEAHANEWRQSRCKNRRRLNAHCDDSTNQHGDISINVRGLIDDTLGSTQEQFLENCHKPVQAQKENEDAQEKRHQSGHHVVVERGAGFKQSGTRRIAILGASNEPNSGTGIPCGVIGILAHSRVKIVAASSLCDALGDLFVDNDQGLRRRRNDLFEKLVCLLPSEVEAFGMIESVKWLRYPVITSRGNRIKTVKILNMS